MPNTDPVNLAEYFCPRCRKADPGRMHKRYYCPRCHEVACGGERHGETIVFPHYKKSKTQSLGGTPCLGGEVDPIEDRAP